MSPSFLLQASGIASVPDPPTKEDTTVGTWIEEIHIAMETYWIKKPFVSIRLSHWWSCREPDSRRFRSINTAIYFKYRLQYFSSLRKERAPLEVIGSTSSIAMFFTPPSASQEVLSLFLEAKSHLPFPFQKIMSFRKNTNSSFCLPVTFRNLFFFIHFINDYLFT